MAAATAKVAELATIVLVSTTVIMVVIMMVVGSNGDDGDNCGDDLDINKIFKMFDFLFNKYYRDFIVK